MSTRIYTLPIEQTLWEVPSDSTTEFNWEYDQTRDRLTDDEAATATLAGVDRARAGEVKAAIEAGAADDR